jgi:hypothetical protein
LYLRYSSMRIASRGSLPRGFFSTMGVLYVV